LNAPKQRALLIGIVASLALAGFALAQTSTNYDVSWWTFGAGDARQSTNYRLVDSAGQAAVGVATSSGHYVESGFMGGVAPVQPTATPTMTPTPTRTATPGAPTATRTPTPTATPTLNAAADAYEVDDACAQAKTVAADGSFQQRTFHREGDVDWIRFTAQANKTYIIQIENLGPQSDAVIFLHDTCAADPASANNNAFGVTVTVEWDATKNGDYFIQLRQFDPSFFGAEANYRVSVRVDQTPPPAPTNPRCIAIDATTLAMQWQRSPARDVVRYRVNYANLSGTVSGSDDVLGGETTYYQLGSLTPNDTYQLRVQALDFSNNESPLSGQVQCTVRVPEDTTVPQVTVEQPSASAIYTTTASQVTVSGAATDGGSNLSRAYVRNLTTGAEGWDYTLEGASDTFRVVDLPLAGGDNIVRIQVFDAAGNSGERTVLIRRLGDSPGAVIIVAGHNETFGLQTNIYNATNRAYRIFRSAGFSPDDIYYLAPVSQDADNDGAADTRGVTFNPAAVQQAFTIWARSRVGPEKPLFVYLMDHGLANKFCVNGCGAGNSITPDELDVWLRTLETDAGVEEITVVYEACLSGSFVQREGAIGSISKLGRVIITSTGFDNNAYASPQGAYFSDAFFSCVADSGSLKQCFDEGRAAVLATGVNQTPFLDDNGDGVFNAGDGAVAQNRFITRFFSSVRPVIENVTVVRDGANGVLSATVAEGAEDVELVWAAVFPPSFQEPADVTLNLNAPVVRLEATPAQDGAYRVEYPNGFIEGGNYRIVFYAQDRLGLNAAPVREGEAPAGTGKVYLPLVTR
jgi:hypothetical protein